MKQSEMFTRSGVIYHPITTIIGEAKNKDNADILVRVIDNEVFDEAMVTIMNRFPQAVGVITKPHSGCRMPKRNANIIINIEVLNKVIKLHVVTEEEYQANKSAIDAHPYTEKHNLTWSGGNI